MGKDLKGKELGKGVLVPEPSYVGLVSERRLVLCALPKLPW